MTQPVSALLRSATARLTAAGVDTPRVDAELLLAHALGVARGRLVLADAPDPRLTAHYDELVTRRCGREPLQHLVGVAPFRHLDLAVGPGVFVPRPETELLVDEVLADLLGADGAIAVDLCSGSGALALALAQEAPSARVVAVERSPEALVWLRRNAAGSRVRTVGADIRDPDLLADLRGRVAVIVCNPPYVPSSTALGPEVRADPPDAVFAGPDGLDLIPDVIEVAAALLRPGGRLALEHDDTHGHAVPAALRADPRWYAVRGHPDLTGRPRFATARRCHPHR